MRIKISLRGRQEDDSIRSYLLHVPTHLKRITDLTEYISSKSDLVGQESCKINLSIDGASLFSNDLVQDLLREGDAVE